MTPEAEAMIRAATDWSPVPLVPEITLRAAPEPFGLWQRTGRDAPPFWAFPWAGGQGLARYVLDRREVVAGRRVHDVASGSGLVAIAAAKAGARSVVASDVDEHALAVIALNAEANAATQVTAVTLDLAAPGAAAGVMPGDVVLAGDVFYQKDLAATAMAFLGAARRAGAVVLAADPARAFVPRAGLTPVASYEIPVLPVLEDAPVKTVTIYSLSGPPSVAGRRRARPLR